MNDIARISKEPPDNTRLLVVDDGSSTFIGYTAYKRVDTAGKVVAGGVDQPLTDLDDSTFVLLTQPIRAIHGVKVMAGGVQEKLFQTYPVSVLDWVDCMAIRPTRWYWAGPEVQKIHTGSWASFVDEYERSRAEGVGVVLATSEDARKIDEMTRQIRRH